MRCKNRTPVSMQTYDASKKRHHSWACAYLR